MAEGNPKPTSAPPAAAPVGAPGTATAPDPKTIKKPRAILMDVSGTLTQGTFVPMFLVPYFESGYKSYLEANYEKPECRDMVDKLRMAAEQDKGAPKIAPDTGDKAPLIESMGKYIEYCVKGNKENKPFIMFRFKVWFDGYDRDKISPTPVYEDVARQVQKWRTSKGIQLYVLSNGWNVATKKFLEKTSQGNISTLYQDFFDTEMGPLNETATFQKVLDKIKVPAQDVLFLTKSVDEARAAKALGIMPWLVLTHSKDVEAAKEKDKDGEIPYVRTLNEIDFVEGSAAAAPPKDATPKKP